jgi:hypothetical protein
MGWRVAQILVIETNLGAPRAGFAREVFNFAFAGKSKPSQSSRT